MPLISYSRRIGAYIYDLYVYEGPYAKGGFCGKIVNLVRVESGHIVTVTDQPQDVYGATPDEVRSGIDAAMEAWVKDHPRPQ